MAKSSSGSLRTALIQAASAPDSVAVMRCLTEAGRHFEDAVDAERAALAWDAVHEALAVTPNSEPLRTLAVQVRNVFVCVICHLVGHRSRDCFLSAACAAFGRSQLGAMLESRLFLAYKALFGGATDAFYSRSKTTGKMRPARVKRGRATQLTEVPGSASLASTPSGLSGAPSILMCVPWPLTPLS